MSESILSPTTPSSGLTSPPADNTKNSSVLELEQQQATSSPPSTSLLSPPPAQADPPIVQGPPSLTSTPPPTSTPSVTPPPFRPPPSPPPPQQPTNPPPPPPSALSPPPSPSSGSNAPPPTQATPVVNSPPPPTTPTTIPSSPPPSTQITPPLSPPSNPSAPPTITSPSPATPSKSSATPSVSPPARRSPHLTTTKNSGSRPSSSSAASASASSSQSSYATATVVAITVAAGVLIAFVAIFFVVTWRKRKKRMNGHEGQYKLPNDVLPNTNFGLKPAASPRGENSFRSRGGQFSYEELMSITSGFSRENQIGEGGFGPVYRGVLPDGKQVAVKQLKLGSGQGEREFRSEVEIISRVHHRHLVSLVGYCVAEHHRLLVYEFVSNKTLEHHLHGQGLPVLDWPKRMKIAIGSARGLAYLHEDCHPRIIHRDIKSANILLDDSFEAQVADFGLAKLSNDTHTHVSTRVMGTFGYLAPEYASSGKLTDRSDVYSFGVVLLELITGRKPIDSSQPLGDESLVEWARPRLIHALDTGDYIEVVDPKLENNFHKNDMLRVIEAAAACVRHSAPKRPRMVQVLRALDSDGSLPDLSNGVKFGQSTIFDSGQYSADIQKFHRLAFDSDIYSMDCDNSGER